MTLHLEEFQVNKLTTVSLCDTVDSLQNTSSKANRDFDTTESILNIRNNSYAKKVHKACNLKPNSLGVVSLTKCITDYSQILDEIKSKLGTDISATHTRILKLVTDTEKAHNDYFSNPVVSTHYTLQYAYDTLPIDGGDHSIYPEGIALAAQLPVYTAYKDSKKQSVSTINSTLLSEYKKFTTQHNKNIQAKLDNTLSQSDLTKETDLLNKYKDKQVSLMFADYDPELRLGAVYSYYIYYLTLIGKDGISGLSDVKNWSSILFTKLNKIKAQYLAADSSYNYVLFPELKYFSVVNTLLNNMGVLIPETPNKDNEPKIDIVSYQDSDVNFFNTKLLLEIFGHPSLNVESIAYNNPRQLLSIDSVGVDKNNPNIIKSNFTLKSGNEVLEHIIPSNKVFHIGYKFKLSNVTVYGYVTSDTLSTTLKLDTKELDFKSIPYIPIKLQNTSLAKDKRLEENSLYFEEFLRNLYIPYYKLDSKITNLGLAKYTVNTDSASLNYPLNDVISNVGIGIGVPVNSESASVCKYLTYLFSKVIDTKDKEGFDIWNVGKKGTNVNDTDEFPYLYENQLSFKSDMGETIIGYSYIEQEEKTGKLSEASSKIIKGTNIKINYGSVQRLLKYGINILSNGFGFSGISTHIHGNNIYYDDSKLEIKVQTNEDKYIVTTVYGFTHTFIVNSKYPLKDIESNWLVYEYESNYTNSNPPKYLRTTKDTTRTTFGLKTNETTTKVLSSYIDFRKKVTVYENKQVKFNYVDKHVDIEPSENINVSIPLIYFDIQDKNSDYYKLKMINTIESLFFDSIQLQIICTIPDKQLSEMARELRSKLLFSYMYFFIDPKEKESDYKDFRTDNYVGIGLTYYNAIPRRNPDNTLDPVFLELQYKREWEVKNMLTKGTTSNLYKDEHSHINNALTGLYKHIDFIEPFFDIRNNYKKPMFNN